MPTWKPLRCICFCKAFIAKLNIFHYKKMNNPKRQDNFLIWIIIKLNKEKLIMKSDKETVKMPETHNYKCFMSLLEWVNNTINYILKTSNSLSTFRYIFHWWQHLKRVTEGLWVGNQEKVVILYFLVLCTRLQTDKQNKLLLFL